MPDRERVVAEPHGETLVLQLGEVAGVVELRDRVADRVGADVERGDPQREGRVR